MDGTYTLPGRSGTVSSDSPMDGTCILPGRSGTYILPDSPRHVSEMLSHSPNLLLDESDLEEKEGGEREDPGVVAEGWEDVEVAEPIWEDLLEMFGGQQDLEDNLDGLEDNLDLNEEVDQVGIMPTRSHAFYHRE